MSQIEKEHEEIVGKDHPERHQESENLVGQLKELDQLLNHRFEQGTRTNLPALKADPFSFYFPGWPCPF